MEKQPKQEQRFQQGISACGRFIWLMACNKINEEVEASGIQNESQGVSALTIAADGIY